MTYADFQAQCAETYCVPSTPPRSARGRAYLMLGALEETGEVAGVLKRVYRDSGGNPEGSLLRFEKEVGDAEWYLAMADASSSWLLHPWYKLRLLLLRARLQLLIVTAIDLGVLPQPRNWVGWREHIWRVNGEKLRDRKTRGVLHGSGDSR